MPGLVCHFHADEWSPGVRQQDGTYAHSCDRTEGHPGGGTWHWLEVPQPKEVAGLTGLADELNLEVELPAAVAALGEGWWEYGLVERSYAECCPEGRARMVRQWGHTAITPKQYTASSYLAGTLGRLSRLAVVAYHPGVGTGRWSYNTDISWWSTVPPGDWSQRTAWVDVIGDQREAERTADAACRAYVPSAG